MQFEDSNAGRREVSAPGGTIAGGDAFLRFYDQLRSLARLHLAGERPNHTLQPTALVHEAFLRMLDAGVTDLTDAARLYRTAATAMRRILIDHARGKRRIKRGRGRTQIPLEDAMQLAQSEDPTELLEVDDAIERLAKQDQDLAEIVRLRFYVGLDMPETAGVLGRSVRTVFRDWAYAKAWLHRELCDSPAPADPPAPEPP